MPGTLPLRDFKVRLLLLVGLVCLVGVAFLSSVRFGVTPSSWNTVVASYLAPDDSTAQTVIRTARVPRAIIALVIGGNMAIAGALAQAVTRNPLASPGVFGINAGAAAAVVTGVVLFSVSSFGGLALFAFGGASISTLLVYVLGSVGRDGLTPVKITLAGAALGAFYASLTSAVLVANEQTLGIVLFWLAGSVAGAELSHLSTALPVFAAGWLIAALLARPVTTLMLGEDVARGLGLRTTLVKIGVGGVIALLAGGSVAIAGPISLIGLIVPHAARTIVGHDQRWVLPYSFVLGAGLLLTADIGSRFVAQPQEAPVGTVTAVLGALLFVHIARRRIPG